MKVTEKRPIIVKRKKPGHSHHGGAWKIAFADFMTALMALFLVLWILSVSDPEKRRAVAEYFRTPLVVAMTSGDRDSSSTSAIPGGGPDPSYNEGEVRNIDIKQESRNNQERERLVELKRNLEQVIDASALLRELKSQILIDMIPEGLRIQLVDTDKRPMFEIGSTKIAPYMRDLLRTIAPILNTLPNDIQISGHTDSLQYSNGEVGYSNWELSADRANASRRELVFGGLDKSKLIRVAGMADKIRYQGAQEMDAVNRRIAIIVVDSQSKKAILNQDEEIPLPKGVSDPIPTPAVHDEIAPALTPPTAPVLAK
ncbi:flagellar motor protein MotB [Pseudomonas aeruginosa]